MATVRIGENDLEVRNLRAPGGLHFKRTQIVPWRKRLADAQGEEAVEDAIIEGIHLYVGTDEITVDWLKQRLGVDLVETFRLCVVASGETPAEPRQGEAARP